MNKSGTFDGHGMGGRDRTASHTHIGENDGQKEGVDYAFVTKNKFPETLSFLNMQSCIENTRESPKDGQSCSTYL